MSDIQKHVSQVIAEFNAAPLELESAEQYTEVGTVLKKVTEAIKKVEAYYAEDKVSTYAVYKAVMDDITATKSPLETAKLKIKKAMDEWNRRQREEAARLRIEAQKAQEEAGQEVFTPPPVIETPKVAGVKEYSVWRYKIVDPAAVPEKYRIIDEAAIAREVREMKALAKIPGVEIWEDKEVRG